MIADSTSRGWLALLFALLAIVLAALLVGPALGWGLMSGMGWGGIGPMGPGMMGAWGAGVGRWWGLAALAFWALIAGAVALLVIWGARETSAGSSRSSRGPLDILKERYARGELTREQYEQMRQDLQ